MLTSVLEALGRLYPLRSGCGLIANSAVYRWLAPDDAPDTIARVAGGRAAVPGGDYVGRAMRFFGDLDPKVSWVVDRITKPGDIALDIGSNLGLVSLRMAHAVGPNGQVHAFEPQPRIQEYLEQTQKLNPGLPIHVHGIGLGDQAGELALAVPKDNAGAATMAREAWPGQDTIKVPVHRLDAYAAEIGLSHADVVKMDVEGFEAQVLRGSGDFFKNSPPRAIIMEENKPYPEGGLAASLMYLQGLGYDLYGLPKRYINVGLVPIDTRPVCHDFVAVHSTCPDDVRQRLSL